MFSGSKVRVLAKNGLNCFQHSRHEIHGFSYGETFLKADFHDLRIASKFRF